jgi:hypothetical protein
MTDSLLRSGYAFIAEDRLFRTWADKIILMPSSGSVVGGVRRA